MLVTEWAIRPSLMPPERFVRPIHLLYAALSTLRGRRPCGQTLQRLQTFRIANLPTLYEIAYYMLVSHWSEVKSVRRE